MYFLMKSKQLTTAILLCFLFFTGCSREDSETSDEPEYFSAIVDGDNFFVDGSTGTLKCEKLLTEMGTVNLSVTVKTHQGESIEFLVLNYTGKRSYWFGDSFNNKNRIAFLNGLSTWSSGNVGINNMNSHNILDIANDNGSLLQGTLSFEGYDPEFLSRKAVTNGKFNLRVRPVE